MDLWFCSIESFFKFDKYKKHSGNKINSGSKVRHFWIRYFDFSKFSSKLEPTVNCNKEILIHCLNHIIQN